MALKKIVTIEIEIDDEEMEEIHAQGGFVEYLEGHLSNIFLCAMVTNIFTEKVYSDEEE